MRCLPFLAAAAVVVAVRAAPQKFTSCKGSTWGTGVKNNDGFLELKCGTPTLNDCDEFQGQETCVSGLTDSCPPNHYVKLLSGRFDQKDRSHPLTYRMRCCTHPGIAPLFKGVEKFGEFSAADNQDRTFMKSSKLLHFVSNVLNIDKYDAYSLEITSIGCEDSDEQSKEEKPDQGDPERTYEVIVPEVSSDPIVLSSKAFGGIGLKCFDGQGLVRTPAGPARMHQLRVGDMVAAFDATTRSLGYTRVTRMLHALPHDTSTMVRLSTKANTTVTLSHRHLLPVVECDALDEDDTGVYATAVDAQLADVMHRSVYAERARVGHCLLVTDVDGDLLYSPITDVAEVMARGVYSPLTENGGIMVDGTHASCYSTLQSHGLLHAVFSNLDYVSRRVDWAVDGVTSMLWGATADEGTVPLPQYAMHLLNMYEHALVK